MRRSLTVLLNLAIIMISGSLLFAQFETAQKFEPIPQTGLAAAA